MNAFASGAMVLLLAGCAGPALLLDDESTQELPGCYVLRDRRENSPFLLQLHPDRTYSAHVHRGLNIWAKATGDWSVADGALFFGPSRETSGWHHYIQEYRVYRRPSGLLIDGGPDVKLVKDSRYACSSPQ